MKQKVQQAFFQTAGLFKEVLPILVGILLVVGLMHQLLHQHYHRWFTGHYLLDPLIGATAGAISFGLPITSYITGGELLQSGVSLLAVTAFLLTWTTVGLVMIPLEAASLGKRFAILRNLLNFVFALFVAAATALTLHLLP